MERSSELCPVSGDSGEGERERKQRGGIVLKREQRK